MGAVYRRVVDGRRHTAEVSSEYRLPSFSKEDIAVTNINAAITIFASIIDIAIRRWDTASLLSRTLPIIIVNGDADLPSSG